MIYNIYKKLPYFIQDIIVTVKNNHTYFLKYRVVPFLYPLNKRICKLDENLWINDKNTLQRINSLIDEATKNVPYYMERKDQFPTLNKIDEISKLPILYKSVFRKNNSEFISLKSNKYNSYSYKTSGTSGTPLYGKISLKELHHRFLSFLSSLKEAGIDYSASVGRFLGAEVADEYKVYRKDFINNHYLFSIYHISDKNIEKYYKAISTNNIEIIEGYPSTIYSLVKILKKNNLYINSVKHVLTTAEKLLDHQKVEIENYFNCKIFDYYGSSEGSTYIYSTHDDKYLASNKVGFLEVVDEQYNPVLPGQKGRMLITSFSTKLTPLIRYDIGDYCLVENIRTGEDGTYEVIISEIIGRDDEVFVTEEGKHFTRFSLCLKYLPEDILESQLLLTQMKKDVELHYTTLTDEKINAVKFKEFENKFQTMLGMGYKFTFIHQYQLKKKARGKLRAVYIKENEEN